MPVFNKHKIIRIPYNCVAVISAVAALLKDNSIVLTSRI